MQPDADGERADVDIEDISKELKMNREVNESKQNGSRHGERTCTKSEADECTTSQVELSSAPFQTASSPLKRKINGKEIERLEVLCLLFCCHLLYSTLMTSYT